MLISFKGAILVQVCQQCIVRGWG